MDIEEFLGLLLLCARVPLIEGLDGFLLVAGQESDDTMENGFNVKKRTLSQSAISVKVILAI